MLKAKKGPEPHLHIIPSIVLKDYRWRVFWDRLQCRPLAETFYDWLAHVLLTTFGDEWLKEQRYLKPEERHVITHWIDSYREWQENNQTGDNKELAALIFLAYDLYCLQTVEKLPDFIINRLKNQKVFPEARYETAVAALAARAGCQIIFPDDQVKKQRSCRFIAKHQETGIEIGIETAIKGDIRKLLSKTRTLKPADIPHMVFIDLNIPPTPNVPLKEKPWVSDIREILAGYGTASDSNPDPFNISVFTNFTSFHNGYDRAAAKDEYFIIKSEFPQTPLSDPHIFSEIEEGLRRYTYIPKEV